ncbi:MAG: hypothetical protein ACREJM_12170 [Candidatus Saccharimonadales bacterium]
MEYRRRQIKIERTPEEKARLKAIRERFQKGQSSKAVKPPELFIAAAFSPLDFWGPQHIKQ